VLHNLREEHLAVEMPHAAYVGRWESQERVFRDMRACQNLASFHTAGWRVEIGLHF
jgi:hypothetical protein